MNNPKLYYRFKPIGVDFTSESNIKKHSKELNSFNDLSDQFTKLKIAYDTQLDERVDIAINILPDMFGVTEICAFHNIKRKLFSKTIKKQCFLICVTKYESNDMLAVYEYETTNFEEMKSIFDELIINQAIPKLSFWKRIL